MFSRFRRPGIRARGESQTVERELLLLVSHELRTPLNAIIGFAQLLQADSLNDAQRECLEHIRQGASHMLEVTAQLLASSGAARLEAAEPVELTALVAGAAALCGPLAAGQGLELRVDPTEERWAMVDARGVTQVLLNLISNAIRYNRPGGSIAITLQAEGETIRLDVADTGIGIEPASIGCLFRPFERLGAGERGIEGTGLGLAMSRAIVEGMGGAIEVCSEPGLGSTFSLRLPTAPSPLGATGVPAPRVGDARRRAVPAY
jgi:signal transduction histidine kinase